MPAGTPCALPRCTVSIVRQFPAVSHLMAQRVVLDTPITESLVFHGWLLCEGPASCQEPLVKPCCRSIEVCAASAPGGLLENRAACSGAGVLRAPAPLGPGQSWQLPDLCSAAAAVVQSSCQLESPLSLNCVSLCPLWGNWVS